MAMLFRSCVSMCFYISRCRISLAADLSSRRHVKMYVRIRQTLRHHSRIMCCTSRQGAGLQVCKVYRGALTYANGTVNEQARECWDGLLPATHQILACWVRRYIDVHVLRRELAVSRGLGGSHVSLSLPVRLVCVPQRPAFPSQCDVKVLRSAANQAGASGRRAEDKSHWGMIMRALFWISHICARIQGRAGLLGMITVVLVVLFWTGGHEGLRFRFRNSASLAGPWDWSCRSVREH